MIKSRPSRRAVSASAEGSHPGVHCDYEARAIGVSLFQHTRLQAVTLAQPVRHVEARDSAEHLDGRLEEDNGGGAVHVIVAVKQHRLTGGDGSLQPGYGFIHTQHKQRVMKMRDFRIKECEGFSRLGDAASYQQFCQHQRQAGCLGQFCGLGRMRLDKAPALAEELSAIFLSRSGRRGLRLDWPRNRTVDFSAHRAYSSSSS